MLLKQKKPQIPLYTDAVARITPRVRSTVPKTRFNPFHTKF